MKDITQDLLTGKKMPVLDVPKIGYDNTTWSNEKRMLSIGNKTVQVSPDSAKKIPIFSVFGYG